MFPLDKSYLFPTLGDANRLYFDHRSRNKNLFDIDFETGDTSQFDSVVNPDDDLAVGSAGAMVGTANGLSVLIDDANPVYGSKSLTAPATNKFRCRFYLDPNTWTMGGAETFTVSQWFDTSGPALYGWNLAVKEDGGDWETRLHHCVDGGYGGQQAGDDLLDAPNYIEFYIQRAMTNGTSNGRIDWWINGVAQTAVTGIDNYDLWPTLDAVQIGAVSGVDAGTSGTFFLDEIAANDTGLEIGA